MKYVAGIFLFFSLVKATVARSQATALQAIFAEYDREIARLPVSSYVLDYKTNFLQIPGVDTLRRFEQFYKKYQAKLSSIDRAGLPFGDRVNFDHLEYIIRLELRRNALERAFKSHPVPIPANGLFGLPQHRDWYNYYVQLYTSLNITPDSLYAFGESEVARVRAQILRIKKQMGFENREDVQAFIKADSFQLRDENQIAALYKRKEQVIRAHLYRLFYDTAVPPLEMAVWQNATIMMPPAIYRIGENRFDYNFASGVYNRNVMDWVLNHEGIPGHHYQFNYRSSIAGKKPGFVQNSSYPGNFEGWACYTEYLGKELGQYMTLPEELAKWEWDLVRSVRVVMDVGIHYFGWSKSRALQYWKEHIAGEDDIAEREITRVTNWPGQALSYKVGASQIEAFKQQLHISSATIRDFHRVFLNFSCEPLEVIKLNIEEAYQLAKNGGGAEGK